MGLIVVFAGFLLLLDRLNILYFPYWMLRWPVILIFIGLLIGIKKRFQSVGWLILVLVGTFFLLDDIPGFYEMRYYSLPVGLIIVGFFLVYRASVSRSNAEARYTTSFPGDRGSTAKATEIFSGQEQTNTGGGEDYIDLTTVFGSIKKRIFSKSFKGGQTTNIFGGTDIDLTQADIEGRVVIDIVQVFGGVKLIVPANWEIKPELTSIFGGVEDKRPAPTQPSNGEKMIVVTGTSLFGGIEFTSY
jgi:predicted membrane protein